MSVHPCVSHYIYSSIIYIQKCYFISFIRESSQTVDVDVFRHREIKWLEMLQNWDKWINKKFPKVSPFKGNMPQLVVTFLVICNKQVYLSYLLHSFCRSRRDAAKVFHHQFVVELGSNSQAA